MNTRGIVIAFEGRKDVGKTTQARLLVNNLNNIGEKTEYMSFPNINTNIGKIIDGCLKGNLKFHPKIVHLIMSANRWEMQSIIKEKINQNINIVLDTYYISGMVYSRALNGINDELFTTTEIGLIKPDITILLTHPYENDNINTLEDSLSEKLIFDDFIEDDWWVYNFKLEINTLSNDILSHVLLTKNKLKEDISYL